MSDAAPRYTHTPTAVFDGSMWQPAIKRGNHIAHTSVQKFDDSETARQFAKDWMHNLRRNGQCFP